MRMKQKLFSILALLLMAVSGAWAQTETLLTTITPTGDASYNETTTGVVTVTPSNMGWYDEEFGWCWWQPGSLTVEAKEGYTITKCVFKQNSKTPVTITTSPFAITFDDRGDCVQNDDMDGVTSIEVYGPAAPVTTYSVTLAEGTEDADQWTIEPKTGLKGGETVTATYSGEKKVKSVKAVKKAAAAVTTPLDNTTTAWTAGTFAVPAGGLTYGDAITVSGDVTLTLTDGETLTLNKGISLASGATLTIQGNGMMVVNGTSGSTASTVAGSTGTLILTSGTLTATGGNGQDMTGSQQTGASGGAAINGSVTVNGGSLTANGGNGGNCIGYAMYETNGGAGGAAISGDVTITDGAVAATGGNGGRIQDSRSGISVHGGAGGAAIGGNATLTGGTLTTKQGADGTKMGRLDDSSSVGTGGKAVAGTVTNNGGTVN